MAFSKRGKTLAQLKRAGLIPEDDICLLHMGERAKRHQEVKRRRRRLEIMRELKKDELGW